jgi:glyceraldehyde-3-phosphate dehydrogenase (NADP+)
MRELIDDAIGRGARVLNRGGGEACASLMRPAVVYPVEPSMRLFHEEQFGPVVPVAPYPDISQAIAWQRESPHGQQVGIWGPRGDSAALTAAMLRLVARVNLDDVCQRGPDSFGFTATDKSGFGVLSLRDALMTFSRPALIQSPDPTWLQALR